MKLQEAIENELLHIQQGATAEAIEDGYKSVFLARCAGNADAVLQKAKEVCTIVVQNSRNRWPSDEEWKSLIPGWFIQECVPPTSRSEYERWNEWWRNLPDEERRNLFQQEVVNKKWSLFSCLYWFRPEIRPWYWWRGALIDANTVHLEVVTEDWPFATQALQWMLRASGALSVEEIG